MPTILLVENEPVLLQSLRYAFESSGYTVLSANSGESAIRIFKKHRGKIDVLISDVEMRRISGFEVAALVKSAHPNVIVILMSGSPRHTFANLPIAHHSPEKPFDHQKFLSVISSHAAMPANAGGNQN